MLRDVFHALIDGFGYVIASLVGALVALTFSTSEPIPEWYYIVTMIFAVAGAVVMTILRRGIDVTFPSLASNDDVREAVTQALRENSDSKHREVMAELEEIRCQLDQMRSPWWRRLFRGSSGKARRNA